MSYDERIKGLAVKALEAIGDGHAAKDRMTACLLAAAATGTNNGCTYKQFMQYASEIYNVTKRSRSSAQDSDELPRDTHGDGPQEPA